MNQANDRARRQAASARRQMVLLLAAGILLALSFSYLTRRWILLPVQRLMRSAQDVRQGNLELSLPIGVRDEIGQLSEAFNDMVASLRQYRRDSRARLSLLQRSTQQAFKNLPAITAIVTTGGIIDAATEQARDIFGLHAGGRIQESPHEWLRDLFARSLAADESGKRADKKTVQLFVNGEERFFQPRAVPVLDADRQPTGVLMTFRDVTQQQQNLDMKRGLVATVSHQFKTPLTSIRMAIHLLLEEKIGDLNEKQAELLVAAREDSDRLNTIIEDLLDLSRIESGKAMLDPQPVSAKRLAAEAAGRFAAAFHGRGIALSEAVAEDAPEVLADANRMGHVFDNLLSNALKHTMPGGTVTISAQADARDVVFSVADTGEGIPGEYLDKIFTQFFRIPGQDVQAGAGLGLAIAREIVEAHGGQIGLESTVGKGSVFKVRLKRAAAA